MGRESEQAWFLLSREIEACEITTALTRRALEISRRGKRRRGRGGESFTKKTLGLLFISWRIETDIITLKGFNRRGAFWRNRER